MRGRRLSNVARLVQRGDVERLVEATQYREPFVGDDGSVIDLGVSVRIRALEGLLEINQVAASEAAEQRLEDPDGDVRLAAVRVIGVAQLRQSGEPLAHALADWGSGASAQLRHEAADVLVAFRDPTLAWPYVQRALYQHPDGTPAAMDPQVVRRLLAIDRHGREAERLAWDLVGGLSDPDERLRARTAKALEAIGSGAMSPVIAGLGEAAGRLEATRVLGALRDVRALPALIGLVETGSVAERATAARALGAIRHPNAVPALVRAGHHEDVAVRDAAADALDALGTLGGVVALAALLSSPDDDDRDARGTVGSAGPPPAEPLPHLPHRRLRRLSADLGGGESTAG